MTIPRISSLLIMLACGHDAMAMQMGQISSESVRGQPLSARVTLYGMSPATDAGLSAELLPAFGAPADSLAAMGMRARIETDAQGVQAIVITSSQAFDGTTLALRVRLQEGANAVVRLYELNIPAAPTLRAAELPLRKNSATTRRPPRAITPAAQVTSIAAPGNYGPVRAGQSLWGIMQEVGLAGGDSQALMHDIVAANPQAFIAADPSRLRVGAMLQLPGGSAIATVVATTHAEAAPQAVKQITDAETTARLERLAVKFAEIRARYAEQQKNLTHALPPATLNPGRAIVSENAPLAAPAAVPLPSATAVAPKRVTTTPATAADVAPRKRVTSAKPAPKAVPLPPGTPSESPLDMLLSYFDGKVLVGLGASLLFIALLVGARFGRRLRSRLADAGLRSADRELVAEIARKAEKRVQLEGEVKRMMADRRESGEERAESGLRPADLLGAAHASLEDIETQIAHGQYNEAEAMLEQTIVETPSNHRAKLRLAEIYYLNERHEEFVDLADEIHRKHRADIGDENWSRLMRMGKVIAPDRPPFSGPVAVEAGRRAR